MVRFLNFLILRNSKNLILNFLGMKDSIHQAVDGRFKRSTIDNDSLDLWSSCGPGNRCISKNACDLVGLLVNVTVAIESFDCGPTLVCCSMKEAIVYEQQKIEGKTRFEKFSKLLTELRELEKDMRRKDMGLDPAMAKDTIHPSLIIPHPIKDFTEKRFVSIDRISWRKFEKARM